MYAQLNEEDLITCVFDFVNVGTEIPPALETACREAGVWEHVEPLLDMEESDDFDD